MAGQGEHCPACGQVILPPLAYGAGVSVSKRIGIAVSIALHVFAALYYLTRPAPARRAPPPTASGAMVYVAPLAPPKPKPPPPKPEPPKPEPAEPVRPKPAVRAPKAVASITPPRAREVYVPPVVSPMAAPQQRQQEQEPPQDMQALIAARRKARGEAPQPDQAPQESEAERANRIARANIAGAQGRNSGSDRNDTGGVFAILNQTSHGADINFRGWNGNFKRNWTKQEHVELALERDIETAIVNRMIELIRKEKPGDFVWDSRRLGRQVPLSARVEDAAELQAFLLREFFPDYRRRR